MIKNFLETKAGRNMAIGLGILAVLVLAIVGYSLMNRGTDTENATNDSQREETNQSSETRGQYSGTLYSGKWYSNRSDDMTIELDSDGTYWATSWIERGKYYMTGTSTMVLEDEKGEKKEFQLQQRMGSTIMYRKEDDEEIFLYPNEEIKEKMEAEDAEQIESAENAVNQMWSDVLQKGKWEDVNAQRTFTLEFKEKEYIQTKIEGEEDKKEEVRYKYTIKSIVTEREGATFTLSRVDSNDKQDEITFKITEEGSKYILAGRTGTFMWHSYYEKKYEDVTLTQDGTTREDAPQKTTETTDENGNRVIITERDVTENDE